MKTMILLMFSFSFITGSLHGQKDKFIYIDSDINEQILQTDPISRELRKPDFNLLQKFNNLTPGNFDRFILYQDSLSIKYDTIRPYSAFVVVEEFPEASGFCGYPFVIKPDTRGKLLIIKPETSVKYYLIIKDPIFHSIIK